MPTTQKPQQKHTKATQKVGGSAKKPVTKAMEGGSAKKPAATKVVGGGKAAPSKGKTPRGGSAKGGGFTNTWKEKMPVTKQTMDRELQLFMDNKLNELQQQNARMENELEKLSTQINELKKTNTDLTVGLKLHRLYIQAILEKYPKPEAEQIINTVTDEITMNNEQIYKYFAI